MSDKKFALITNAKRQSLVVSRFSFYPNRINDVQIDTSKFRTGEIALLDPEVASFYSNLNENLKKATNQGSSYELTPTLLRSNSSSDLFTPWPSPGNGQIFAVMYDTINHFNQQKIKGYFILSLKPGEFIEFQGSNSKSLEQKVKALRREVGISESPDEKLDDNPFGTRRGITPLEENLRYLLHFQDLMQDRIYELPFDPNSGLYTITKDMVSQEAWDFYSCKYLTASK